MNIYIDVENPTQEQRVFILDEITKAIARDSDIHIENSSVFDGEMVVHLLDVEVCNSGKVTPPRYVFPNGEIEETAWVKAEADILND